MATYNGARYIREAIDSALSQTLPPTEIIVVDDGSVDETAGILRSFGDRITVVRQTNQGHSAARNAGLAVATGEFIALLDHDDTSKPERFERQWRTLQENPDAASCFSGYWLFNDQGVLRECPASTGAARRPAIEYLGSVLFH